MLSESENNKFIMKRIYQQLINANVWGGMSIAIAVNPEGWMISVVI